MGDRPPLAYRVALGIIEELDLSSDETAGLRMQLAFAQRLADEGRPDDLADLHEMLRRCRREKRTAAEAGIRRDLADLDRQEEEITDSWRRRACTLRQFERATAGIQSERQSLQGRLARAAAAVENLDA